MRPGRAADHSSPSSATVMEEYSYTYIHPLGHTGPVTGSLYLLNESGDKDGMQRGAVHFLTSNAMCIHKYWAEISAKI